MGIKKIKIKNYKSIKKIEFNLENMNCIIGENGSGKTNILEAIKFFYSNLTSNKFNNEIIDRINPYIDFTEISLTYDFNRIKIIAENQINNLTENALFYQIVKYINQYADENNYITINMKRYKDNLLEWYPEDNDLKRIIKNIFPIITVSPRNINLTDWDDIWDMIASIGKESKGNSRLYELNKDIEESVNVSMIREVLKKNEFEVEKFNSDFQYKHILQFIMGGNKIKYKDNNLIFYSDGTNSFNYLNLYIDILNTIAKNKLKEITILLDEPELNMHPIFIDKFSDKLYKKDKNVTVIISTHSTRLVKNIITYRDNYNIFHVNIKDNYSYINKVKNNLDSREKAKITERETSIYFSKGVLLLEGDSEIQLFSNYYIRELFEAIKVIDIVIANSNDVLHNLVNPVRRGISLPYLSIVDLDKILDINIKDSKLTLTIKKGKVNPLFDNKIIKKEKYYYGDKRIRTFNKRINIINILKEFEAKEDKNVGVIKNTEFNQLVQKVCEYCNEYNTFVFKSTVEGALINEKSYMLVYNWIKSSYDKKNKDAHFVKHTLPNLFEKIDKEYLEESEFYKIKILKNMFSNKCDDLKRFDKTEIYIKYKDYINKIKFKKTDWITEFMEWLFEKEMIKYKDSKTKKEKFKEYFPEIYDIINKMSNKI